MERTLSIIKPDGVNERIIGKIIKRFENSDLKVVAMKMLWMTKQEAEGFYDVHRTKGFFDSLTDFMSSGPVVVMVLEGEDAITKNRKIMGATNPQEAKEGTIRKEYASSVERNIVHGSDAPETAQFEISYFFSALEMFDY
ncbi:MAG: nucleoside-diphosphate kinase [Thermodesulfobacteriota bacterium]|nr:nucleoside-diphosphate kinase [Thermodesulfobacteriota bacterium]